MSVLFENTAWVAWIDTDAVVWYSRHRTSLAFIEAVNAPETGEAFILLLTLNHDNLSSPMRFCDAGEDTVSRGNTFLWYPMQIQLASSSKNRPPKMQLTIDNVHRDIVQTVRELSDSPTVLIEVILASTPNTVEMSLPDFIFTSVQYDRLTVQGNLALELLERQPYPAHTYNPQDFPGLF